MLPSLVHLLTVGATGSVAGFVGAVVLDDLAGIALAVKAHSFSWQKLPSFLQSTFGDKRALALLGILVGVYLAHAADANLENALLAALVAGCAANAAAVLADAFSKVRQLVG